MPTKSKSSVFRRKPGLSMVFGSPKTSRKKIHTILTGGFRRVDCWWCSAGVGIVLGMDLPCHLAGIFGWDSVDPNKRGSRKTPGGLGVTSKQPPHVFRWINFFEKIGWLVQVPQKSKKKKRGAQFSLERSLLAYDQKLATGFPRKIFRKRNSKKLCSSTELGRPLGH